MKIIIITYQSGIKEAVEYSLDALHHLEAHFQFIENIEIIDITQINPQRREQ